MSTERTKEKPVKEDIKELLDAGRVHYRMPPANGYGKMGDFDFVCCVRGRFLGIEAKRDALEHPTQLQTDNALATMAAGGVALLIHKDNLQVLAHTLVAMQQGLIPVPSNWPPPRPQLSDEPWEPPVLVKRRKP